MCKNYQHLIWLRNIICEEIAACRRKHEMTTCINFPWTESAASSSSIVFHATSSDIAIKSIRRRRSDWQAGRRWFTAPASVRSSWRDSANERRDQQARYSAMYSTLCSFSRRPDVARLTAAASDVRRPTAIHCLLQLTSFYDVQRCAVCKTGDAAG